MQNPERAGSSSEGRLSCIGCRTLLRYPLGAQHVRCSVCQSISPVTMSSAETANLICGGCRTMLAYPAGSNSVRCTVCSTINLLIQGSHVSNITCEGCHTPLMYTSGATSVKCSICNYVTPVGTHLHHLQPSSFDTDSSPSSLMNLGMHDKFPELERQDSNPLIVVQNPSVEGEEAYSMAMGVKIN